MPFALGIPRPSASHELGFTAGKLLCIGRNYAEHAREMNAAPLKEPVVFLKPATALVASGGVVELPPESRDVHHELELVVVIGRAARRVSESVALDCVAGYALGLDMTARDLQAAAKKAGLPWTVAKGFDTFAPLGPITPREVIGDPQHLELRLEVNGVERQRGTTADMLFPVATLIAYCSRIFTLEPGDLIYTGTPEGVAAVAPGDRLRATGTHLAPLEVTVAAAPER